MEACPDQQSLRVHQDVPLASFGLLGCLVTTLFGLLKGRSGMLFSCSVSYRANASEPLFREFQGEVHSQCPLLPPLWDRSRPAPTLLHSVLWSSPRKGAHTTMSERDYLAKEEALRRLSKPEGDHELHTALGAHEGPSPTPLGGAPQGAPSSRGRSLQAGGLAKGS